MLTSRTRTSDLRIDTTRTIFASDGTGVNNRQMTTHYPGSYTGSLSIVHDNNNGKRRKVLSDCSIVRTSRTYTESHFEKTTPDTYRLVTGDYLYNWLNKVSAANRTYPSTKSSNMLLIEALGAINSSAVMSGEILGDLGKTIGMLRRPFGNASKLLKKIQQAQKRRLKQSSVNAAKASASAWLEYRYGWKPIIMDCDTIVREAIKFHGRIGGRTSTQRCGSSSSSEDDENTVASASTSWSSGSSSWSCTLRRNVGIRYRVQPETDSQKLARLAGVRAEDLPATIWERVPYSFVLDWFANIGDVIQAAVPRPNLVLEGHWCTDVVESRFFMSASVSDPDPYGWRGLLGNETITSFEMSRVCNQPITLTPELRFGTKPVSVLHQADAVSLLLNPILGSMRSLRH